MSETANKVVEKVALAIRRVAVSRTRAEPPEGDELMEVNPERAATAAIEAHTQALAEQGLVIVPREPTEGEWLAYKEKYSMVGTPEHLADESRVEKYYRRLRERFSADRQAMINAKEGK